MSFSPAFKWFIALLLPLTLAWKLVAGVEYTEDQNSLKDKILAVLVQHQFEVAVTDKTTDSMPIIRATRGSCNMFVGKVSAYGWDRDYIRRRIVTNASDHIFIVFQGRIYTEQPTWRTAINELWSRFIRKLGFVQNVPPVLAVVATAACDAEHLPWNEVRDGDPPQSLSSRVQETGM